MTTEWKLVPVEPTDEMLTAGQDQEWTEDVYAAMLAAAPAPPAEHDRESKVNELVEFMDHLSGGLRHFAGAIIDAGWAKASPVPSAGGEVEVLGYRYHHPDCKDFSPVMTNDKATDEERGDWAETALVDRAHVTRLQVDLYQMTTFRDNAESHMRRIRAECTAVEKERDRLQSELTKAREALEGMVEYFPEGHSDGECFTVERAKAVLAHQSAPAAKCETCDGTGHDLDGGMNPAGGAADCLDCGGRGTGAKGGE